MEALLPFLFMSLSALALVMVISFLWASFRTLLGAPHELYVEQSQAMRKRADLLNEKETVLRSLKDLEFEREVGKLSDEDFSRLDAEIRARAKRILRALDDDLKDYRVRAQKLLDQELGRDASEKKSS